MYGQSFVIYCMSECALATGNRDRAGETAEHTFDLVQKYAADTAFGGYREMFLRDWQPRPSGAYGGDRKSIRRAHAPHGSLHDALRADTGRDPQAEAPGSDRRAVGAHVPPRPPGRGIAQFSLDFTPLPAIIFKTVWGADRDNEGAPRPLDNTSYGHNIEFLWLFLHALEVLGESADPWKERLSALARHTVHVRRGPGARRGVRRGAA